MNNCVTISLREITAWYKYNNNSIALNDTMSLLSSYEFGFKILWDR
jgi:hypothetical protein